jgi:hypothetical protein
MRAITLLLAAAGLAAFAAPASALPQLPIPEQTLQVVPVAQGCGWGAWRGPWGGCRNTPYSGRLPGGGWTGPAPVFGGNGCPPGFWRGPWGHCRDTPYHGALPGGGWK